MRISDWSSDVCSSDLPPRVPWPYGKHDPDGRHQDPKGSHFPPDRRFGRPDRSDQASAGRLPPRHEHHRRSEEHTSELQSLMRISYAVFCLKKKKKNKNTTTHKQRP